MSNPLLCGRNDRYLKKKKGEADTPYLEIPEMPQFKQTKSRDRKVPRASLLPSKEKPLQF